MSLDPFSVIAPARVRVLLLPYGPIRHSRFVGFIARLEQEPVVRLGDVSPDGRPHRTMFSPLAFPAGSVLFDLSTSLPPPSYLALGPFELFREPMIIVAIADGANPKSNSDNEPHISGTQSELSDLDVAGVGKLAHLSHRLKKLQADFPKALVHQFLVFDYDEPNPKLPDGVAAVSSPKLSRTTTMKTVMCDLTSRLLAEMTTYAKSLQALPTVDSPKEVSSYAAPTKNGMSLAAQRSLASGFLNTPFDEEKRSFSPLNDQVNASHSSLPQSQVAADPQFRASSPHSRPRSVSDEARVPPTTFDEIAVSYNSSIHENKGTESRDSIPMHGFGAGSFGERERNKGKARIGIVIGALYLLAGRWPDAVRELAENAAAAKTNNDHLWHAKALDYMLVGLLMSAWAGIDFQIPSILYPGIEKPGLNYSKLPGQHPAINPSERTSTASDGLSKSLLMLQNLSSLVPDLVQHILNLYVRSRTFTEEKLPQLLFSDSTIRFSKLLTVIGSSNGVLDDFGLQRVVLNTDGPTSRTLPASSISYSAKAGLVDLVLRAFPSHIQKDTASVMDRVMILSGIASVLSELGFHRKKAFVLREILATLLPALVQVRKDGAAEMGFHPAASLASLNGSLTAADAQHTRILQNDDDNGIRRFLTLVCHIYGIPAFGSMNNDSRLNKMKIGSPSVTQEHNLSEVIVSRIRQIASQKFYGDHHLKSSIIRLCINICEALPDLGGVLYFSAGMLRTAASGTALEPQNSHVLPTLPIEEQARLANNIFRTLNAARHLGISLIEAEYWDDFLVRGVEIINANPSNTPISHKKREPGTEKPVEDQEEKTPFIYNPIRKSEMSITPKFLLVDGEAVLFRVTLQNLYDFDVEIEEINLQSSDLPFVCAPASTIIGPCRMQTVLLTGIPKQAGVLNISGCRAKVKGCQEREFLIFNEPWVPKVDTKISCLTTGIVANSTMSILNFRDSGASSEPRVSKGPFSSTLSLTVISAQPSLVVRSISLPQSAVMLLEGEMRAFTVVLQNTSSVLIDLLYLSFDDSITSQLRSALANKELSPIERYELELTLLHKKPFRWQRDDADTNIMIEPGMARTLTIEVFGTPGLSQGIIQVDYGSSKASENGPSDIFFTRQLTVPLTVTVNASVELGRTDIVPFTGSFAWQNKQRQQLSTKRTESPPQSRSRISSVKQSSKSHNCFQSLLGRIGLNSQDSDHCLLHVDFRNSWPNLLSVSIDIRSPTSGAETPSDTWKRAYTVHEPLQPGHTSRIILLLPRIYISNSHRPIPSLIPSMKRQYIVSSAPQSSLATERATREAFHYREALLDNIRATWEEDSTHRTGMINLRALQLSMRMVNALKLDDLDIALSIRSSTPSSSIVQQLSLSRFKVPTCSFLTLTTTITNRSSHSIHALLRLQPTLKDQPHHIALDIGKKFLWSGLLQRSLGIISPGEKKMSELGCTVLCKGVFEVGALVEEITVLQKEEGITDEEPGGEERRVWRVKEKLVIQAQDEVTESSASDE